MATLKDLSRHLGISVTQVSRALNGHSDVSLATRKKVEAAAKQLNYAPNVSARKLVSGRSGIIALVQRNRSELMDDPTFMHTAVNLSLAFSKINKQFVLHVAPEDCQEIDIYQKLISSGTLDGFVISEPRVKDERIEYLLARGIPFVVHGTSQGAERYAYFDIDNFQIGYQLTELLIKAGHRRIAFLNGPHQMSFANERYKGYRLALNAHQVSYYADYVAHGHMSEHFGLINCVRMCSNLRQPPTAFIASSVRIASGIYKAAQALGLSIPEQLAVVAHDDVLPKMPTAAFSPPLTVTRSQLSDSWTPLTKAINQLIEGDSVENHQITKQYEWDFGASHAILSDKKA